jgi:hypothetical protein
MLALSAKTSARSKRSPVRKKAKRTERKFKKDLKTFGVLDTSGKNSTLEAIQM